MSDEVIGRQSATAAAHLRCRRLRAGALRDFMSGGL